MLLPILFYTMIHFGAMGTALRLAFSALIVFSVGLSVLISVVDVEEFLESLRHVSHVK